MTTKELLEYHAQLCGAGREIMKAKNHDYSGASGETPFLNFEVVEKLGICTTEQGFMVRILDKLMRINTYMQAGELKVENEGVQDAIVDDINYLVLLAAYIKQKHESNKP